MRAMLAAALAGLLATAAGAQATEPGCIIVYGQARNLGEAAQNGAWDRINTRFNAAVTARLKAQGLRAMPLVFKVGDTDVAAAVETLKLRSLEEGCARVADTAVFADEKLTLTVRLRVHPVIGAWGPLTAPALPRIGPPAYTSQREFDFNERTLERLKLEAIAEAMVDDYLVVKRSEAAASPSR